MEEKYGCAKCGMELTLTRTKVTKPSDPTDIPHEIVTFKCSNCGNEFKARSPAHPHPKRH